MCTKIKAHKWPKTDKTKKANMDINKKLITIEFFFKPNTQNKEIVFFLNKFVK